MKRVKLVFSVTESHGGRKTRCFLFDCLAVDGRSLFTLPRTSYVNVRTNVLHGDHFLNWPLSGHLCFHGVQCETVQFVKLRCEPAEAMHYLVLC
jgi:hypothetical protein